jgi:hypothetical protein
MELKVLLFLEKERGAVNVMIAHKSGEPKLVKRLAQLPEKALPSSDLLHLSRLVGNGGTMFLRHFSQ